MLSAVLKKEFHLSVPWGVWLFPLLASLTIIPQYPIIVGVGYAFMGIFIYFQFAKDSRDIEFSSMLPVPRKTVVYGKVAVVAALETVQLLFCVPFAVLANVLISPQGNLVGIDPNPAFFGIALIGISAFNIVMLPLFFRTGYKLGLPILAGLFAFLIVYGALEITIQCVPIFAETLDTPDPAMFGYQAILLAAGILCFAATLVASAKRSVRNFEKVSI